jgi:hypothetical protein
MVSIAQLVRALDCGSRGCGFKSHYSPFTKTSCFSVWNAHSSVTVTVTSRPVFENDYRKTPQQGRGNLNNRSRCRGPSKSARHRYHLSLQSVDTFDGKDFYLGMHACPQSNTGYAVRIAVYQPSSIQLPECFIIEEMQA